MQNLDVAGLSDVESGETFHLIDLGVEVPDVVFALVGVHCVFDYVTFVPHLYFNDLSSIEGEVFVVGDVIELVA